VTNISGQGKMAEHTDGFVRRRVGERSEKHELRDSKVHPKIDKNYIYFAKISFKFCLR
jgi:hypothetical protein